jgi:hypothetical protein
MTTVLVVYNRDGVVGCCDARCHEATTEKCACICGGANHGNGTAAAIAHVRGRAEYFAGPVALALFEMRNRVGASRIDVLPDGEQLELGDGLRCLSTRPIAGDHVLMSPLETLQERLQAVADVPLSTGSHHEPPDGQAPCGFCIMEKYAFVTGMDWSDNPSNCSQVIGAFFRAYNDQTDQDGRNRIDAWVFDHLTELQATADDGKDTRRGFMVADWSVRQVLPVWLDAAGASDAASTLRAHAPITDRASARLAREAVYATQKVLGLGFEGGYWAWRTKLREAVYSKVFEAVKEKYADAAADAAATAADAAADAAATAAAADATAAATDAATAADAAAAADATATAAAATAAATAADAATAAAADATAADATAADAATAATAAATAAADAADADAAGGDVWGRVYSAVRDRLRETFAERYAAVEAPLKGSVIELLEQLVAV